MQAGELDRRISGSTWEIGEMAHARIVRMALPKVNRFPSDLLIGK
jgi:hypothetical protein